MNNKFDLPGQFDIDFKTLIGFEYSFLFQIKNENDDSFIIICYIDGKDNILLKNNNSEISLNLYVERDVFHNMLLTIKNGINMNIDDNNYECDIRSLGVDFNDCFILKPIADKKTGISIRNFSEKQ